MTERDAAPPAGRGEPAPARRFGEALRRAERGARGVAVAAGAAAAARARAASGISCEAPVERAPALRRAAAGRADGALRERREAVREEAQPAAPPPALPSACAAVADAVSTPELRALVRTLPLAVQTFGVREGAPLALSFGRSLDVELRQAPRGVELVLRPEARLARATEGDLPGVVAALRARGIAVARAEVRPRPAGHPGSGARVDLAAGVR